jgi:hypothetical protein
MVDQKTPEPSDVDTTDEKEPAPPPPKTAVRHTIGGKKKAAEVKSKPSNTTKSSSKPEPSSSQSATSTGTAKGDSQTDPKATEVPPTRALPFAKKTMPPSKTSEKTTVPESDSETDDEL